VRKSKGKKKGDYKLRNLIYWAVLMELAYAGEKEGFLLGSGERKIKNALLSKRRPEKGQKSLCHKLLGRT